MRCSWEANWPSSLQADVSIELLHTEFVFGGFFSKVHDQTCVRVSKLGEKESTNLLQKSPIYKEDVSINENIKDWTSHFFCFASLEMHKEM